MSKSNSTVSSEAIKASSLSQPPVPVIQTSLNQNNNYAPIFIQRSMDSVGYSPQTSPSSLGSSLDRLDSPSMQAGVVRQLQRSYGNSYVGAVIQRRCECGGTCTECPEEKKKLQRKGDGNIASVPADVATAIQRSGEGSPLPSNDRGFIESRFGQDFGDVRIHEDSGAGVAARELKAQAFTAGRDIYFAPGRFQPQTPEGQKLLAHELTHVVQQRSGMVAPGMTKTVIGAPGDAFEQEADRASEAIVRGDALSISSTVSPVLQMAGDKGMERLKKLTVEEELIVPAEKGKGKIKGIGVTAAGLYEKAKTEGRLANISKFSRPSTSTLRNTWKRKVNWDGDDDAFASKFKSKGDTCEIDHIIELQIGGGNNKENLQLLEKSHNASVGSRIGKQIQELEKEYGEDKIFKFTMVKVETGVDDECRRLEEELELSEVEGKVVQLKFGKSKVGLNLGKETPDNVYDLTKPKIRRSAQIIAGLELQKLSLEQDDPAVGKIDAIIISGAREFVTKSQRQVVLIITGGEINLEAKDKILKMLFPFLSEANFNARLDDEGLAGEGKFNPTLPLLKSSEVQLKIAGGKFSGGVKLSPKDVNIPIPGVTVTESSIEVLLEEGQISATGVLAFKLSTFADAKLEANVDKSGFVAKGTVDFHMPGLDTAKGTVLYKDKKLSGRIDIETAQLKKIPGVQSASLVILITDESVNGTGEVKLTIPGIKKGTLGFALDKEGNYGITGVATLDVPGLKAAEIGLTYRDGDLEGLAKVGLDIPGLEGAGAQFEIKYAKGLVTGAGDFEYKKVRLSGKVRAALNEKRRLTGGGELAYEIIPGLVAAVGMEIREDGTAKISGELRIPEKIDIFPQKSIDKKIFGFGVQIPIFAIPLGTRSVGLVAEIGADLKARAGIGPGQIRQLKVKAAFDPAKEESQFEFSGGGELFVPAFAELALGVHGGIGLSIAIASATGGIELVTALGLHGALSAMVQITYQNSQFAVDAVTELSAQPSLKFDVNAYVKVEASLIFTTIEVYRKDWNLASKEWGGGLKIGLRFPVHYVFGQPFELSLDQVEFIVPEIDVKQAVKDLLPM